MGTIDLSKFVQEHDLTNSADFICSDLNQYQKNQFAKSFESQSKQAAVSLLTCTKQNQNFPFLVQLFVLMVRHLLCVYREWLMLILQVSFEY